MKWFINPYNVCLAFIPRTGSTTFANSILSQYYPEILSQFSNCVLPINQNHISPQFICPFIYNPTQDYRAIVLVRDPIERFISGFARVYKNSDVQQVIDDLLNNKIINAHIAPQSNILSTLTNRLLIPYKFPLAIEAVANELGLIDIPSIINESDEKDKPQLTSSQIDQLEQYYFKDRLLFNNAFTDYWSSRLLRTEEIL